MAIRPRSKRPLDRALPHQRDTRLVVIATEGGETEKQYFKIFGNKRVQVRVLPTETVHGKPGHGHSAPRHVLARLADFKRSYELRSTDQLWLMIDTDRWPAAQLAEVVQGALQRNCGVAVSNPSFELWLYLHHDDVDAAQTYTPAELEGMLRSVLGSYNKSRLVLDEFRPHIDDAVRRAVALDTAPAERWPNKTGTHVYRVVQQIRELSGEPK